MEKGRLLHLELKFHMHHFFRLGLLSLFVAAISACNSNKSTLSEPVIAAIPTQQIIESVADKPDSTDAQILIPKVDPDLYHYVSIMPIPDCPPPCYPPIDNETVSLTDELNRLKPMPQVFQFDAGNGIQLTCAEGTILNIPAGAFSADGIHTTNGIITFKVTEYYKMSDIIASGLHTKSDKGRLESGGMVYLEAQQGINQLQLLSNKEIKIQFADYKQNMQTFVTTTKNGEMIWVPQDVMENAVRPADYLSSNASFPGGNDAFLVYKEKNLKYPDMVFYNCTPGVVIVQFIVTINGNIDSVQVVKTAHPLLDSTALQFVRNMPQWIPANENGQNIASAVYVKLVFESFQYFTDDPVIKRKKLRNLFKEDTDQDFTYPDCFNWEKTDSTDMNATAVSVPVPINKNVRHLMDEIIVTRQLGYINCDRFVRTAKKEVNLTIQLPKLGESRVVLIFPGMRSVLNGSVNSVDGRAYIYNVDEGLETQLFVLREENGTLYYCVMPIITGATPIISPVLTPIEYNELETIMNVLDGDKVMTVN
jgi:TonB family protein